MSSLGEYNIPGDKFEGVDSIDISSGAQTNLAVWSPPYDCYVTGVFSTGVTLTAADSNKLRVYVAGVAKGGGLNAATEDNKAHAIYDATSGSGTDARTQGIEVTRGQTVSVKPNANTGAAVTGGGRVEIRYRTR